METLIGILLRRPVAVTAFCILVVALAVVAAIRLPIALLPSLEYPALVIWTAYPDVPPQRVERAVTERIEEAVVGTSGLVEITSRSQLGGSLVRTDFGWNIDLDLAALHVRQELDRLGSVLPQQAERPVVLRIDPSDRPILVVAMSAEHGLAMDRTAELQGRRELQQELIELKQIARDVVARRLEQIVGVARVQVTGGYDREIEIIVSPEKLAAYGIDLEQIAQALQAANVALTGGTVRRGAFRYAVEVTGEFRDLADVAATVVSKHGRPPVYLRQVATVGAGVAPRRGLVRLDGRESLLLLVKRRPEANTVKTVAEVHEVLTSLPLELPGVRLDVLVDESVFIEAAITGVLQAIGLGGLLAIAVLLLFLRRPRALLAVALTVPMALAITLVLFDVLDVSLNLISLSGLALGVGMLVDNAIVVVENIARLRDKGLGPMPAARRGGAEVAGAITASTLTTMAVFLPLTFVEGLAGRLFRDQSVAVVCSLAASLLVALTVVPLIASRENGNRRLTPMAAGRCLLAYERMLDRCLRHRGVVILVALGFLGATGYLAWQLPRETIPASREGCVEVELELPTDADLVSLVAKRSARIESAVARWPEVRRVLADLGERDEAWLDLNPRPLYRGDLILVLAEGAGMDAVLARLNSLALPGHLSLHARPIEGRLESLLVGEKADLQIDLTSDDWTEAQATAERLLRDLELRPELTNVASAHPEHVPAYQVTFNRDAILRFGARPHVLEATLQAAARGREATRLRTVNDQIPIVIHSPPVDSIESLLAERTPVAGGLLPLHTFVKAEQVNIPAVLVRNRQTPAMRITADVAQGADLEVAIRAVGKSLEAVLPPGVRGWVSGSNEAFRSSLRAMAISLLLSVLLVYLILAAQFESLLQPVVILSTVPLAAGGVVVALAATNQTWNLMSFTGCVVLVGIVVNDAIVKVDFINQRRRTGLPLSVAVREAGRDRVRPVLMTTLTTALGLLPLSLGIGKGAALRVPLAVAIVGGLVSSTLLTLTVLPVIYTFADKVADRRLSLLAALSQDR
ncbi:MAG: efflux RND transporter permease subunit [bacterium]|nr:efflux RND transporter permease subunit [bacterium]